MSKKGSTSSLLLDEAWICEICSNSFASKQAEMMECEYCEEHFCRKCLNITQGDYKVLSKRSDAHWYCPKCEKKAVNSVKMEKQIEERCKAFLEKMENRVATLEEKVKDKPSEERVREIIQEEVAKSESELENKVKEAIQVNLDNEEDETTDQKLNEIRDWESRRNNIVIYNSDEPTGENSEQRKLEDMNYVKKLCCFLETDANEVATTIRLGMKANNEDGSTKNRPLKVVFKNEKAKTDILRNARKLQNADEKFKKIGITHDLTKKEREKNSERIKEAKEMNEQEPSGDWHYVVRGPYWDRRVVKLKKKVQ